MTGCQASNQTTVEKNDQLNNIMQNNDINRTTVENKDGISILRYKVNNDTPVFSSGRTRGYLALDNNCLVIQMKQGGKSVALALPISDDSSQWQTKWDSNNQELIFQGQRFKLGSYLDLGGGGRSHNQVMDGSEACSTYDIFAAFSISIIPS